MLLISCAMGPQYSRPDIATSDSFRMAGKRKTYHPLANAPWWELYHDEELQKLIRIALEENKDLKRAVATVDEFCRSRAYRQNRLCPQMNATVNAPVFGNSEECGLPGFPSRVQLLCRGISPGKLMSGDVSARSNEAALGDLLAREENPTGAHRCKSWVGVAQAYFDLRQFDMQLEIAQRTLQAWEESVRIGQARLRQGVINRLDVDQFEAERENAAARIAELTRQMVQKGNELSILLGGIRAESPGVGRSQNR